MSPPAPSPRAVLYLRVSTDEQAESGLGLAAQEKSCRQWCKRRGYDVAAVERDEGISGVVPFERRPGLARALAALRRGDVLVAARRDRIARDALVAALIDAHARRRGARVETPDAPADDEPFSQASRAMQDVFAQLERGLIGARTRAALRALRERGGKTGGDAPYGWSVGPGPGRELVRNEEEQHVLKMVRRWRRAGLSLRAIAARLNDREVPARGARWHTTTVARLVAREG